MRTLLTHRVQHSNHVFQKITPHLPSSGRTEKNSDRSSFHEEILTSNARLRTCSALSRRNHFSELSANYLFKADAIHVSLSRIQTLYTIKQVTLVSATRLTFD